MKDHSPNPNNANNPVMEAQTTGVTTHRSSKIYMKHKITTATSAPAMYQRDCTRSCTICEESYKEKFPLK